MTEECRGTSESPAAALTASRLAPLAPIQAYTKFEKEEM